MTTASGSLILSDELCGSVFVRNAVRMVPARCCNWIVLAGSQLPLLLPFRGGEEFLAWNCQGGRMALLLVHSPMAAELCMIHP